MMRTSCCLMILLLQVLSASYGEDTVNLPADVAVRLMKAKLDGKTMRPIPISWEVYKRLMKGPFPGDQCQGLPCRVPFPKWYCFGLCKSLQTHCHLPTMAGNTFCQWCEDESCFSDTIPSNSTDEDSVYYDTGLNDYSQIAYLDPK
ncbi:uncharacterized protein [Panulirus ornatus]|uniref:uncharacterized protein n=1 Tax=Panulirus ornatus TaxID=150431 RepID=UPI003A873807